MTSKLVLKKGTPQGPTGASNHRDGGIEAALELAGQLMGLGHGHETDLFDGLTSAAQGDIEALMAKGFDAIWIDMHHQGTDFAAGGLADRHGRNGVGHRSCASPRRLLQGPHSGLA